MAWHYIYAFTSLVLSRLKVHHPNVLHQPTKTRHELQVRRVLLEVILPVFFALEFAHKAVRESSLVIPSVAPLVSVRTGRGDGLLVIPLDWCHVRHRSP